jgi:hypothetical protein
VQGYLGFKVRWVLPGASVLLRVGSWLAGRGVVCDGVGESRLLFWLLILDGTCKAVSVRAATELSSRACLLLSYACCILPVCLGDVYVAFIVQLLLWHVLHQGTSAVPGLAWSFACN